MWEGVLLDAHNRYEICKLLGIKFKTVEQKFADRDAAMVWIIQNQFCRRNLAPFARAELALKLKPLIAAKANANRQGPKKVISETRKPIRTDKDRAKAAGVGVNAIYKAEQLATHAPESTKAALRAGTTTINRD